MASTFPFDLLLATFAGWVNRASVFQVPEPANPTSSRPRPSSGTAVSTQLPANSHANVSTSAVHREIKRQSERAYAIHTPNMNAFAERWLAVRQERVPRQADPVRRATSSAGARQLRGALPRRAAAPRYRQPPGHAVRGRPALRRRGRRRRASRRAASQLSARSLTAELLATDQVARRTSSPPVCSLGRNLLELISHRRTRIVESAIQSPRLAFRTPRDLESLLALQGRGEGRRFLHHTTRKSRRELAGRP